MTNVISNSAKNGLIPQKDYFDKDIANADNTAGYYIISKNDFVYNPRKSSDAPYGPISRYSCDEDGIVSPLYLCFRGSQDINPRFFEKYFKSSVWHRYIYMTGDSGARHDRVSIKDETFFEMPIHMPCESEQSKIVSFITLVEQRVDTQLRLVESLKKYKRGLLNRYFNDEEGNREHIQLSQLTLEMMDGDWIESKDQSSDGIRLIQTGNVGCGEYIDKQGSAKYVSEETFTRLRCTEIFPGDILVSRLPSPAGRACILPDTGERMITAVDCTIIRCKVGLCLNEYLHQFLNSPQYFKIVESFLAGGTRQRISRKNLESILVPVVSLEEQKHISEVLEIFDKKIFSETLVLQQMIKLRQALLQSLFV